MGVKKIRKVVIKNLFGEVELSSNKRKETMSVLVLNALDLLSKLNPKQEKEKEKKGEIKDYLK